MNGIDTGSLYYGNRPIETPRAGAAGTGAAATGARVLPKDGIDRSSETYKQCQEFESLFVNMMLKEMRKTVEKSGLIDGGNAEDIFEDMLYENYASSLTKTANLGLADQVYRQIAGK